MKSNILWQAAGLLLLFTLSFSPALWGQLQYPALSTPNIFSNSNQFQSGVYLGPQLFANLDSLVGITNIVSISDGTAGSNPCTGSGTGALAVYLNGAWDCGAVGGGGNISGLTAGIIPQAASATSLANSSPQLDNGLTLANTLTYKGSGGLNLPSDGVHAGLIQLGGNTTLPSLTASNTFGWIAPASASFTSYFLQPSATAPSNATPILSCATPAGNVSACTWVAAGGGGGGGGNPTLDNCAPDQTGNSFYSLVSLTNYFYGHWEYIAGQASYINCTVFVPTAMAGATIVLDISANDGTAGHTANFQTCDQVINAGTINIGSLSCAANQTFTTTSTAYNRASLTFNIQSTLADNSILVIKIATSTTGTQPTANMLVYPHFIL